MEETALEIVSRVMDLYTQIDKAVVEFQLKSGLRCPADCGACCATANVEVTILEMLPIAQEILRRGEASVWLERLASRKDAQRCLLYLNDSEQTGAGHCGFYQWRPALCRLFGFAAVRSRIGDKTLSVCKHIKRTDPQSAALAAALADQAPCFIHYSAQVYGLDPGLGHELMPINTAMRQAIERLGLRIFCAYRETLRDNTAA
jgi:Fe-S-cluster containining protein